MGMDKELQEVESFADRILRSYFCESDVEFLISTFAEDIVRGYCNKMDCNHILKDQLKVMAQQMVELAKTTREYGNRS